MNKLLNAGFRRMLRSREFLFCLIATVGIDIYACVNQYMEKRSTGLDVKLDYLVPGSVLLAGLILSVFVSLFVGTEYSEGTVRNKLVTGATRSGVYISSFLVCAGAGLLLYLASLISILAVGIPMFGFLHHSPTSLAIMLLCGVPLTVCYAALYNMLAMLIPNRAVNAVVCILLTVALMLLAMTVQGRLEAPEFQNFAELSVNGQIEMLQSPNPRYLNDIQRARYELYRDLLPTGQSISIAGRLANHPGRMAILSVTETVIFSLIGLLCFRKKDLK